MSSFLVSADCINSIVTYLSRNRLAFDWLNHRFGYDLDRAEDLGRLAQDLHRLNCDALDQRYGPDTASADLEDQPAFAFRIIDRAPLAVHRAASCLLYQCAEGTVPERPLYQALDSIIDRVANLIVVQMPGYADAPWGD